MSQYKNATKPKVKLDQEAAESVNALIANMILTPEQVASGIADRTHEQGQYELAPAMLEGESWRTHRMILRSLYRLRDEGIPQTSEAVLERLLLEAEGQEQREEATRRFQAIMNHRTKYAEIAFHAFNLREWRDKRAVILAGEDALAAARSPETDAAGAYSAFMNKMAQAAPAQIGIRTVSDDFLLNHKRLQDERLERKKQGRATGATFPWAGLREKVPSLKKGELCTILAKSGFGKTTIGMIIAEHNAHLMPDGRKGEDGHGMWVAYFHLETSAESMADRFLSRKLKIQTGAMRDPEIFDHTVEPYKSKYEEAIASWEHNQKHRGKIVFKGEPGMKPSVFKAEVAALKAEAAAAGCELLVIVDYYTEMDYTEFGITDDTKGFAKLATFIKNVAEIEQVYMVNFAQYGVDSDYRTRNAAYGSQKINQRSQVVIRVEREEDAEESLPISPTNSGQQRRDLCNVPMYYHEAGQLHADSVFRVIKANDDQLGPVPVRYVNAYFEILDNPGGRKEIPSKR